MFRKKILFIFIFFGFIIKISAQDITMQNGTFTQCSGILFDSGGASGLYGANENFTLTICPDTAGEATRLDFSQFETENNVDFLSIYNSDTVDDVFLVGTLSGSLTPFIVQATDTNPSGCITLVFTSDGSNNDLGFVADISCIAPCQTITGDISTNIIPDSNDVVRLCQGDSVDFNALINFSQSGAGASYDWDFGNGTTGSGVSVMANYPDTGVYIVRLEVTDVEGCSNTIEISQIIQVSTTPDFSGTMASETEICANEIIVLTGDVVAESFSDFCTPPVAGLTELPDGVGVSYETSVPVSCFEPSATFQNASDLVEVCVVMEHSFLGDLDIDLISPNGTVIRLQDQSGGGTYLGAPNDDPSTIPGTGFEYCFSASGTTLLSNGPTVTAGNPARPSIEAGTYLPFQDFSGFIGSPLNGDWTIRITDNLAIDDGFIFNWNLVFNDSISPIEFSFTPTIISENWLPDPTIIATNGNEITVQPTTPGTICYTYEAVDDFGCTYTTDICIDVEASPTPVSPAPQIICDGAPSDGFAIFNLDNLITTILNGDDPAQHTVTFHISESDAQNDLDMITNSSNYNAETGDVFVRVENNTSGCFGIVPVPLVVEALPTALTPPTFELCDNDLDGDDTNGFVEFDLSTQTAFILDGQDPVQFILTYHETMADAEANTNPLPDLYTNTSQTQTIFARVENIAFTTCFSITPVDLQVNALPILNTGVILAQCDIDTDAIAPFNLTEAEILISGDFANETFEYFDLGGIGIADPTNYSNVIPVSETINVTVTTVDGCMRSTQITIEVTASQIPATTLLPYEECDTDSDGITTFDFSNATAQFEGLFPQDVTISYYETQAEAEAELNAITGTIAAYDNNINFTDPVTGIQQIWVRVDGDTNNDCVGLGIHIELTALPNPTFIEDIEDLEVCSPFADVGTFDLTIKDTEITAGNTDFAVTYYASQADFTAEIPIINPTAFTNTSDPQTIFYSLENIITGCDTFNDAMNFELIVNQNPIAIVPTDLQVCDEDGTDDGFTTIDLSAKDTEITGGFDANLTVTYHLDIPGAIANDTSIPDKTMFVNTTNPQIVVARVTNNTTGCFVTQSLQVEVFLLPVPIAPAPYEVCDNDNDGISDMFVLSSRDAEITGGDITLSVAYYLTLEDAENAPVGGELDVTTFTNNEPFNQTIYARVFNAVGCFATISLDLVVLDTPMINLNVVPFELCDDDDDGLQIFDLTTQEADILAGLDPALYSLEWFSSLVAAENGTPAILTPATYTSNTATVYALVIDITQSTTTFCSNIAPLELVVNPLPIPIQPAEYELCDDEDSGSDIDEFSIFNLPSRDDEITGGNTDWGVTYYLTLADAEAGTPELPDLYQNTTMANQTIFARVEDLTTGCFDTTTLTLVVNPLPSPTVIAALEECDTIENDTDPDNDGDAIFDLTGQVTTDIINGEAFVTLTFHETLTSAEMGTDAITTPEAYETVTRTIFVRATDTNPATATACFRIIELELIVNSLPVFSQDEFEHTFCEEFDGDDTMGAIDLTVLVDEIGILEAPQISTDFIITYHNLEAQAEDGIGALMSPYTVADDEILFVRIENPTTGCFNVTSIIFTVDSRPQIFPAGNLVACADDLGVNIEPIQDMATFDLTIQDLVINGGIVDVAINYYETLESAQALENEIPNPGTYINISNPQIIYARTINPMETCESTDIIEFEIFVQPLPYVDLTDEGGLICVDEITGEVLDPFTIDGSVEAPQLNVTYNYQWSLDGILLTAQDPNADPLITIDEPGLYQLMVTGTYPDGSVCEYTAEAEYIAQSAPIFEANVVEESFNNGGLYTVEITVVGGADVNDDYEFALDDGPFQSSTTFTDVRPGDHTIFGRLANGECTITEQTISIIDYPRFFTPNSDGFHDTWNVIGLDRAPNLNSKIYIFDRQGKLLKQISPVGEGWDGTYNGNPMPSSDYWFRIEFTEVDEAGTQRTVNGHFTLKR